MAVLVLSVIACSSDGAGVSQPDDTAEPRSARAFGAPRSGRLLNEPRPITVIHGLGALRAIPDTANWPDDFPIVADDFLTIAALDCAPGTPGCALESLPALATGEVDVVSLATGRADNASPADLATAAESLADVSIAVVGYGPNTEGAVSPATFDHEGQMVGVHGITFDPTLVAEAGDDTAGLAGPSAFENLLDELLLADANSHLSVVAVDWGAEEDRAPTAEQVGIAQQMIAAGADAIVGNGPRFLQRLERIESIPVVYSLGDSTADAETQLELDTAVFRVEFGSSFLSACLLPATASIDGPILDDEDETTC